MLNWLSSYTFMPHGYCFLWRPEILWLHVLSDATITIAYFSIPISLIYLTRKRLLPHKWMAIMFSLFIFMCGVTHIMGIVTIWYPLYALQGIIKALTAAASLATALLILPLIPQLLLFLDNVKEQGTWTARDPEDRNKRE